MDRINLQDATSRPGEQVGRVQTGHFIDIIWRGKPVAQPSAIAEMRKPIDGSLLQSLTVPMPPESQTAADLVRSMRNCDRY